MTTTCIAVLYDMLKILVKLREGGERGRGGEEAGKEEGGTRGTMRGSEKEGGERER